MAQGSVQCSRGFNSCFCYAGKPTALMLSGPLFRFFIIMGSPQKGEPRVLMLFFHVTHLAAFTVLPVGYVRDAMLASTVLDSHYMFAKLLHLCPRECVSQSTFPCEVEYAHFNREGAPFSLDSRFCQKQLLLHLTNHGAMLEELPRQLP